MKQARDVTATFTDNSYSQMVTKAGMGRGMVTASTRILVWTGNTGTANYNYGIHILLTAAADPGSILKNWTGCDSVNENQCSVSLTAEKSVTATFTKQPK
jgi:hypothetical protein